MKVSVVIPSYWRPAGLQRCLQALEGQRRRPDEIVVVARPDDEATREALRRAGTLVRCVPVTRPGLVAALNAGIDASTGDIVSLTDDDSEPHHDWIERIVATFAEDARIGAVGGRDWVYHGDRLEDGARPIVGRVSWWGRVTGNHHLGVGGARDVDVLKGVNLSVRGDLLRAVRFDRRLLGVSTEHHSEIGLCLKLRAMGVRIVYDPAIAVDHRVRPRIDSSRRPDRRWARAAAHNETMALLEYLRPWRRLVYVPWSVLVGTRAAPGLAQIPRLDVRPKGGGLAILLGTLEGRMLGVWTVLRSRRPRTEHRALEWVKG